MEQAGNNMMNLSGNAAHETNWDGLEPVPTKYAYSGMILTIVLFQILNKIVTGTGAPKSVQKDFWKWKNLYISWIHAVIVGIWDISCFVMYPELIQDPVAYHNMHIYGVVCFSTGYFVYDFMDICLNNMAGKMWEVLVHHVAVASVFMYNLLESRCLAYNVIALSVEVNSAFLHARKLLQMRKINYDHLLYRVVKWCNLVTFVVLRFGALAAILIGMYIWAHRVSKPYYVTLSASVVVMTVINLVLFKRLFKSDVMRGKHSRSSSISSNGKCAATTNGTISNGNVSTATTVTNNNVKESNHNHKED